MYHLIICSYPLSCSYQQARTPLDSTQSKILLENLTVSHENQTFLEKLGFWVFQRNVSPYKKTIFLIKLESTRQPLFLITSYILLCMLLTRLWIILSWIVSQAVNIAATSLNCRALHSRRLVEPEVPHVLHCVMVRREAATECRDGGTNLWLTWTHGLQRCPATEHVCGIFCLSRKAEG